MTDALSVDQKNRLLALNVTDSFIVQAPAGSGKTELLMQRFLALLATCVEKPDRILAITFTNKAANEMKERILQALENAKKEAPREAHKKRSWELACAVLDKDKALGWNLLLHPDKLCIQTIDAFCLSLTKAMPLLSTLGANFNIETDISPYYEKAAENLLAHLENDNVLTLALFNLLAHLDNDAEKVKALLVRMLEIRDQWLGYLVGDFGAALKTHLHRSLEHLIQDSLNDLVQPLPSQIASFISVMIGHQKTLSNLQEATLADWQDLAEKLLTKANTLRARWNANAIPLDKYESDVLREFLMDNPQWLDCLIKIRKLPAVDTQEPSSILLDDLVVLLPYLVAELKLIFQEEEKIDFSSVSEHALLALGDQDTPTDLALALDQKIQHILIDEFQDTSITQFRLLEKLTLDWFPDDGRTLFLVGDPMQSIYRFRQAEVSLFLSAQEKGLGTLRPISLALNANFRSSNAIVNWNNRVFQQAFPDQDDLDSGAIGYHPSVAMDPSNPPDSIIPLAFDKHDKEAQASAMIHIIQNLLSENTEKSIAVLVKSRTHLSELLVQLNAARIPYQAVEIEKLQFKETVQDLLSLTLALLNVDDRLSWLSLLRCPWIGLCLSDLTRIAMAKHATVYAALNDPDILKSLSQDAQNRLALRLPILAKSLKKYGILALSLWIEDTWRALEGPRLLSDDRALQDSELFFSILKTFEAQGIWPKPQLLKEKLSTVFATPLASQSARLHIMTIHKAKGLEFDCVILPRLEATPPVAKKPLLSWIERTRHNGERDLLLAPISAADENESILYDYLRFKNKEKDDFEKTRLLYVASTRAKEKLYLLYGVDSKEESLKAPAKNSFLHDVWPIVQTQVTLHQETAALLYDKIPFKLEKGPILLKRFVIDTLPELKISNREKNFSQYTFSIATDTTAQGIGIVLHKILCALSLEPGALSKPFSLAYLQRQLLAAGLSTDRVEEAAKTLLHTLHALPRDARAKWILNPTHQDAHSEWALTGKIEGIYQHIIIDRSFIDKQGHRWIVDYKTSCPKTNETTEAFYQRMQTQYTEQLNAYAYLLAHLDERPIRLGLYFPLFQGWWSWVYR